MLSLLKMVSTAVAVSVSLRVVMLVSLVYGLPFMLTGAPNVDSPPPAPSLLSAAVRATARCILNSTRHGVPCQAA